MRNPITIALVLAFICLPLQADEATPKPPELNNLLQSQVAYGAGSYDYFFKTVYDISLWTDTAPWSMNAPFALSITYHMRFTPKELATRSVEEMSALYSLLPEQKAAHVDALASVFAPVEHGDRITAFYTPNKNVVFFHNGTRYAVLDDAELGAMFLSIWLSPDTSAPELRTKLLRIPS